MSRSWRKEKTFLNERMILKDKGKFVNFYDLNCMTDMRTFFFSLMSNDVIACIDFCVF